MSISHVSSKRELSDAEEKARMLEFCTIKSEHSTGWQISLGRRIWRWVLKSGRTI